MGHKGSQKFNGSTGKPTRMTNNEVVRSLEAGGSAEIRQKAALHRDKAIDTLARCMDAQDASWPAKCTAARDILAYADGRPHAQAIPTMGGDRGITINIMRLSDGAREQILVSSPPAQDVIDVPAEPPKALPSAAERAAQLLGGKVE
jgi:hypothetical protein